MKHTALCPKCNAPVTKLSFEVVDIVDHDQNVAAGGVFLCPSCHAVLGVGLHPEVFVSDLVERLTA